MQQVYQHFFMHFEWILWAILIIYLLGLKMQQNWFIANNPLGYKEFKNNWYSKWSESAISHFLWYQCTKIKNETVSCHEVVRCIYLQKFDHPNFWYVPSICLSGTFSNCWDHYKFHGLYLFVEKGYVVWNDDIQALSAICNISFF